MYNFDKVINRRNTGSLKWDVPEKELPMWVADMDFQTAPEIREAMKNRMEHGVFGYNIITDEWYSAYQNWWKSEHHFNIKKEWLFFATGVVPIISSTIRKLTTPGENVLIQTPVYNIFFNSILNNGRNVLENKLRYENGAYYVNFEDLEEKLSNPQTTLMILCNPHNPIGKIWEKNALEKIGALCEKYHVTVLSDEIHCDLTELGKEYIPFASVSETCRNVSITCIAPTKTFNLAGLQTAAVFIPNENLRHKVWRALNTDEVAEPNSFAVTAAVSAFEYGKDWLRALKKYIQNNKEIVEQYLCRELPNLFIVSMEATYLLWIDCSQITEDTKELAEFIRREAALYLTAGSDYGEAGRIFLRLNVACSKDILLDGLERLKKGVEFFKVVKDNSGK
ncbi:MAG: pyridoxal phosphate-dependent aminotransferase [Lachnospiraceae bacterium]|nr:pyridoxal phosphate-dependent aminotransferase [Lachnospiraceae bacterium]